MYCKSQRTAEMIVCHALGIEPRGRLAFDLANATVSAVTCAYDMQFKVSFLNDMCHLST